MKEYIIIGDAATRAGALIMVGFYDKARAAAKAATIARDPARYGAKGYTNIRIKETTGGWWHDPYLVR